MSEDGGNLNAQLVVPSGHFRQTQDYSIFFLLQSYYGDVSATRNVTTGLTIGEMANSSLIVRICMLHSVSNVAEF